MPVDNFYFKTCAMIKDMKILRRIFNLCIYTFAIIGFLLMLGFVLSKSGVTNEKPDYFSQSRNLIEHTNYLWPNTEEYLALKESLIKEQAVLTRVEKETGIKPRLLISILFVEQMRLYNSNRELFKKVFEPLKILGVQSQFSWGILGLKQDTLIEIENNLKSTSSPFYLGPEYEKLFGYSDAERFVLVTDEHDHYYTYLYAALFLKQIEKQWREAGFDISDRPEILATLYNIGFQNSQPKTDPQMGGAEIEIGNSKTSFGQLAYEFYYSDELIDIFPR
jgi:hypothetical protein